MCCGGKSGCCEEPEKRQVRPAECTPEQIKECHGDVEEHPCCQPDHPCQGEGCEGAE